MWTAGEVLGTAIVSWGDVPDCGGGNAYWVLDPCHNASADPLAMCPTALCANQAAALATPFNVTALVPSDPNGGFSLALNGTAAPLSSPFVCKTDPRTGMPYPRQTVYTFSCDATVPADGPAKLLNATFAATNGCLLLVQWATALACLD